MPNPILLAVSNVITPVGDKPYAFATRLDDGQSVFISPGVLVAEDITEEDIGQRFWGYTITTPTDHKADRLAAFVRWDRDEDECAMVEVAPADPPMGLNRLKGLVGSMRLLRQEAAQVENTLGVWIRDLQADIDRYEARTKASDSL